jgi:hypothetical protein
MRCLHSPVRDLLERFGTFGVVRRLIRIVCGMVYGTILRLMGCLDKWRQDCVRGYIGRYVGMLPS